VKDFCSLFTASHYSSQPDTCMS